MVDNIEVVLNQFREMVVKDNVTKLSEMKKILSLSFQQMKEIEKYQKDCAKAQKVYSLAQSKYKKVQDLETFKQTIDEKKQKNLKNVTSSKTFTKILSQTAENSSNPHPPPPPPPPPQSQSIPATHCPMQLDKDYTTNEHISNNTPTSSPSKVRQRHMTETPTREYNQKIYYENRYSSFCSDFLNNGEIPIADLNDFESNSKEIIKKRKINHVVNS
jgi:hypothetical protein